MPNEKKKHILTKEEKKNKPKREDDEIHLFSNSLCLLCIVHFSVLFLCRSLSLWSFEWGAFMVFNCVFVRQSHYWDEWKWSASAHTRSKPMIFYDVFYGNTRLITTPHNGQKKDYKIRCECAKTLAGVRVRWKWTKFQLCEVPPTPKTEAVIYRYMNIEHTHTHIYAYMYVQQSQTHRLESIEYDFTRTLLCGFPHLKRNFFTQNSIFHHFSLFVRHSLQFAFSYCYYNSFFCYSRICLSLSFFRSLSLSLSQSSQRFCGVCKNV